MAHDPRSTRLSLAAGELVNLDDARGTTLRVRRGQVWVTQDGDLADHVLDAGTAWAIERNGRTIVQAQAATIVDAALAAGRTAGFEPLTVAVLDAGGHLIARRSSD